MMESGIYVHDDVRAVQDLYGDLPRREDVRELPMREQIERLAERFLEGHREEHPGAAVLARNRLRRLAMATEEEVRTARLHRDDALEIVAADQGFADWAEAGDAGRRPPDPDFEAAVDVLVAGDEGELRRTLEAEPALTRRRSWWGHRATLLHYLAADGVEIYRQQMPANAARLARILMDAGGEPEAEARFYGERQSVKDMLGRSAHPEAAGIAKELRAALRGE
ncbi:MAG: hypothetical protein ACOC5E_00820 [Acidobacteriota bacterium]